MIEGVYATVPRIGGTGNAYFYDTVPVWDAAEIARDRHVIGMYDALAGHKENYITLSPSNLRAMRNPSAAPKRSIKISCAVSSG